NRLGTINHTLLTIESAAGRGLHIAAVVVNDLASSEPDPSRDTNFADLQERLPRLLLTRLPLESSQFAPSVDWWNLSRGAHERDR
ncbi:MAG TPA: AAA family ATPase, partial [Pirellulales bacterium]|nr:AAA family ATPase [Pirellulales bacterium]